VDLKKYLLLELPNTFSLSYKSN